jgi:outer membrane protein insertion porin family
VKKPRWRKFAVAVCSSLVMASPTWAEEVNQQLAKLVAVEDQVVVIEQNGQTLRLARSAEQTFDIPTGSDVIVQYRQNGEGFELVQLARAEDPPAAEQSPAEQPAAEQPAPAQPAPASEQPQPETPAPAQPAPATPQPEQSPTPPPAEQPTTPPGGATPPPTTSEPDQNTPRIVNIEVEGNTNVPTDEVLQVVSTRIGDPLLEPRLKRDAQAIFDLGYFTDVRLDYRMAPGGLRLVFRVLENPMVNEVKISGTNVVGTDKLVSLMETKPGKILNTRYLRSDIEAVNQYYNEELGYLLANHVEDLTFEKGILSLKIKDGMKINQIVVEGVTVFPIEKVQSLVRLKPGDLFNRKTAEADGTAISKLYEDNDYILDTIRPSIDPEKGIVTFRVQEAVLQEIRVEGNSRTTTDTVIRNMRSKAGDVMQKKRIQKDLERLQNLGFFKKVEINPEPGTEPGKVILVLDVEEQKSGLATIGLGYAGGGTGALRPGVTGSVSLSDRNLWGEGKTYQIQVQAGGQVRSGGISYLDPAINDNQDSFGVSVYYSQLIGIQQNVLVNNASQVAFYDDQRYGVSVTYGHPFTDNLRGFVTLRHDQINISRNADSAFEPLGTGKGSINGIAFNSIYDTRDDLFNPHVGTYASGGISYAGLGGSFNFTKYNAEVRHYIPLWDRHTIALRGWYGKVTGGSIPGSEFFYAGGVDTLRGYTQNRFVGTDFLVFNAEYRFPIGNIKFLNGAIFADYGNAWFPGVTESRLRLDGGVGLRIVFPSLGLGVIRVDYAISEEGGRASIGIGQSF